MSKAVDTPLVSVVIVNYNREEDLRQALRSVLLQDYPRVEIVVVDNASSDGSLDMLAREFPGVRVVALAENTGMDGYSSGFREARGEFVFQMDNDSLVPDPTVLSEVIQRFSGGPPDLAAVATRVEEYRSGIDDIGLLRSTDTRRGPINTGGFHSGGVGFRKRHLDAAGYYNRDVFLYGAELFLQMKVLAAGFRIHFFPEILMLHKSSGKARSTLGIYYELRNRYWFMRTHVQAARRLRYLPAMLIHDVCYCAYRRAPGMFFRSLREGFGRLPPSLRGDLRSDLPDFNAKVAEVCSQFGLRALAGRAARATLGRSAGGTAA